MFGYVPCHYAHWVTNINLTRKPHSPSDPQHKRRSLRSKFNYKVPSATSAHLGYLQVWVWSNKYSRGAFSCVFNSRHSLTWRFFQICTQVKVWSFFSRDFKPILESLLAQLSPQVSRSSTHIIRHKQLTLWGFSFCDTSGIVRLFCTSCAKKSLHSSQLLNMISVYFRIVGSLIIRAFLSVLVQWPMIYHMLNSVSYKVQMLTSILLQL